MFPFVQVEHQLFRLHFIPRHKKNDEVIVPTFTFIATINAVIYNQGIPVFMDCDDNCNLDINKFKKFIFENTFKKGNNIFNKKQKKNICCNTSSCMGRLVDLSQITEVCRKNNLKNYRRRC